MRESPLKRGPGRWFCVGAGGRSWFCAGLGWARKPTLARNGIKKCVFFRWFYRVKPTKNQLQASTKNKRWFSGPAQPKKQRPVSPLALASAVSRARSDTAPTFSGGATHFKLRLQPFRPIYVSTRTHMSDIGFCVSFLGPTKNLPTSLACIDIMSKKTRGQRCWLSKSSPDQC